jgi:hypothetical protein
VTGSTANATYEPGEERWVLDGSVWWEWTAPESGAFTILAQSQLGYWPSLAMFTGGNFSSLELMTNSAFTGRDYTYETRLLVNVEAGVAYPIAAASGGDIILNISRTVPPVVSVLSPTNGSVFVVGETINLVADASDPDGTIAMVEFYDNGWQRMGVVTNNPFVLAVDSTNANGYRIQAWATDNHGVRTVSDEVEFVVRPPGPTNDHFADRIDFNASSLSITGATANATYETGEANLGSQGSVWWSWTAPESANFTISVTSMPGYWPWLAIYTGSTLANLTLITNNFYGGGDSSYSTRVVLRAEAGVNYAIAAGSGSSVTLSIAQSVPPEVTLTSPDWDAVFRAGEPVTFSALTSDAEGSVRRVEFLLGHANQLVGVVTNQPFTLTLAFPDGLGRTWIRASAMDDAGLITFSEPVWFEVRLQPPSNDDFANRTRLTGTFIIADGSLNNATHEPGDPTPISLLQGVRVGGLGPPLPLAV